MRSRFGRAGLALALLALLGCLFAQVGWAKTYYVATWGNDPATHVDGVDGTKTNPWKSINYGDAKRILLPGRQGCGCGRALLCAKHRQRLDYRILLRHSREPDHLCSPGQSDPRRLGSGGRRAADCGRHRGSYRSCHGRVGQLRPCRLHRL